MAAFESCVSSYPPLSTCSMGLLSQLSMFSFQPHTRNSLSTGEIGIQLPPLLMETGVSTPLLQSLPPFPSLIKRKRPPPSRSYKCQMPDCSKAFLDSSSLYKHLQTHGEPQHHCSICSKPFFEKAKLRRHMLVHTVSFMQGERTFTCNICEKRFALGFNLKTHMRTHTGERPFVCKEPGCEKRFTQSSNLTSHMKTHQVCGSALVRSRW